MRTCAMALLACVGALGWSGCGPDQAERQPNGNFARDASDRADSLASQVAKIRREADGLKEQELHDALSKAADLAAERIASARRGLASLAEVEGPDAAALRESVTADLDAAERLLDDAQEALHRALEGVEAPENLPS